LENGVEFRRRIFVNLGRVNSLKLASFLAFIFDISQLAAG
jgi:hypothetical protein